MLAPSLLAEHDLVDLFAIVRCSVLYLMLWILIAVTLAILIYKRAICVLAFLVVIQPLLIQCNTFCDRQQLHGT